MSFIDPFLFAICLDMFLCTLAFSSRQSIVWLVRISLLKILHKYYINIFYPKAMFVRCSLSHNYVLL